MVREALCVAQAWLPAVHDGGEALAAIEVLGRLIEDIDRQRPLGPDGKHDDRHTPTCGCDDRPEIRGQAVTSSEVPDDWPDEFGPYLDEARQNPDFEAAYQAALARGANRDE